MVDLTIRSSNIYFTNLCHDLNISASNSLKKPTIKFGSFLFDLKKNNMKEESIYAMVQEILLVGLELELVAGVV